MTLPNPMQPPETRPSLKSIMAWVNVTLSKTQRWLRETTDYTLNQMFALRHTVAGWRYNIVLLLLFALTIVFISTSRPADDWRFMFSNFINALTQRPLPEGMTSAEAFRNFFGALFFNPAIWGRLIALYAPFWLMHRIAAIYLADVFEKDEDVARKFIRQAAFAGEYATIRIREGKIIESDQNSPIVQIGGPGYVLVELDSAALFERPDGTPDVIPPTVGEPKGKKVVDGFERIRQGADLRDIMGNYEMDARNRDGIPIKGKDIQYTFSIYRGDNSVKTLKVPYPFENKAMENLVYKAVRPVKVGVAPVTTPDWSSPLPGKPGGVIQGELGGFVNKRGLSEFLSSIGEPDRNEIPLASRSAITAMFYNEGFKKVLVGKGLQVNWIGVGTLVTPAEITPANYLDTWKQLTRENAARSDPDQLKRMREDVYLQESLRLIRAMPLGQFYTDLKQAEDSMLIDTLIVDYYDRIQSAVELFEHQGEEPPVMLLQALHVLNDVRGTSYRWVE